MSNYTAVLVGINYTDLPDNIGKYIPPLRYAHADCEDLASLLERDGYIVTLLRGVEATRSAILQAIKDQGKAAGPDGTFVFHFAGHGGMEDGTAYMIPIDAEPGYFQETAIPLRDLVDRYLPTTKASALLLDCCRSGHAVGMRSAEDNATQRAYEDAVRQVAEAQPRQGRGLAVLTACRGDENAHELPSLKHGAFTYYALDYWQNTSGRITAGKLFEAIADGLTRQTLPAPIGGGTHEGIIQLRPSLEGESGEQIEPPQTIEGSYSVATSVSEDRDLDDEDELDKRILAEPLNMFSAMYESDDLHNLITIGDRILKLAPKLEPVRTITRDKLVYRAAAHINNGNIASALADLDAAIRIDPIHAIAYYWRAIGHMRLSRWEYAEADFTQVIGLESSNADVYYHRGRVRQELGNYTGALEDFNLAIYLDYNQSHFYKARAEVYEAMDSFQQALRDYRRAYLGALYEVEVDIDRLEKLIDNSTSNFEA